MTRSHWLTLALFLAGLSGMVGAMHDWSEALTPAFVGGVIGLGAAVINASFGEEPPNNVASRATKVVLQKFTGTGA